MLKKLLFTFALLFIFVQPGLGASYKIDPVHSQVGFTVDHLMFFKVSGYFTEFSGTIEADPAAKTLTSTSASIQTTSVDTRIEKRDNHLRSADFFDVATYPEMTFVSKKVEGSGDAVTVHGDLTIRGTTRDVVLTGSFQGENKDPWGNVRVGFTAKGMINRKDFGLTWNKLLETGGVTVGDEVEISLQIQGIKQ
jgi:polyisoprenoid-binding protein YceI